MLKSTKFITGVTAIVGSCLLVACGGGDGGVGSDLAATAAKAVASADGTAIPPATAITDNSGNRWTVSGGVVYKNGAKAAYTSNVTLLLLYGGVVYQQNSAGNWWSWTNNVWKATTNPKKTTTSTGGTNSGSTNTGSTGSTGSTGTTTGTTGGLAAMGVHNEGDGSTSTYDQFSSWLGKPVKYRVTFTARDSWNDVATPYYIGTTQSWIGADKTRFEVISAPLILPSDSGFSVITSGQRDSYFKQLATNIKNTGHPEQVIIRLGWEHNGNWFPWNSLNDPQGYVNAFRHVVQVMRAVAPQIRFDWCTDYQSYSTFDWTKAYPGDDVVDIVSMDVYDEWNNGWSDVLNAPSGVGLNALRTFARAHNKYEAYPEWALSTGSAGHGDSPSFIDNMYAWIQAGGSNVLYHSYWNTNQGGPDSAIQGSLAGNVPKGSAEYKAVFVK
jgi:hypothetical protein